MYWETTSLYREPTSLHWEPTGHTPLGSGGESRSSHSDWFLIPKLQRIRLRSVEFSSRSVSVEVSMAREDNPTLVINNVNNINNISKTREPRRQKL